ncbi:putative necrosis-inducing factor-domain-containing protein [Echria macrotheca]|uniref:Necrosis-inducing factor-domain-containing protein n=1 Tax=Echria macrotheca TaxID=438768 RepID=A0AAJ0F8B0_9PEZI|nr:putative necrosis-inducing factor-domain-containing protein [Echria macrotheca]
MRANPLFLGISAFVTLSHASDSPSNTSALTPWISPIELAPAFYTLDSINDCGSSNFTNESSDASPLVSDCLHLADNIRGGGTWVFQSGGTQFQLAQSGTCAFGVQTECIPFQCVHGGILVKIGNQDIIDVIEGSVARFATSEGKVGSKGHMFCQEVGDEHPIPVLWGIYHSP